jgi:hypothetical protein
MKRIAWLLAPVLLSAVTLYAGDGGNRANVNPALCNSKSVAQNPGPAADQGGDAALVDDEGRVSKTATNDKVGAHSGKKVKTKCKPVKDKEDTNFIIDNRYMG